MDKPSLKKPDPDWKQTVWILKQTVSLLEQDLEATLCPLPSYSGRGTAYLEIPAQGHQGLRVVPPALAHRAGS